MEQHTFLQGTPEWHAHRAKSRNASDAPAMLGCSPFMTRSQLLEAMHSGIRAEVSPEQQRRFDDGHAIEAAQRAGAEELIGEDLFPVVGSAEVDGVLLSASFDGLTVAEDVAYECKTLNVDLRVALPDPGPEHNDPSDLPKMYRVQMEQQLAVSGAERVLFVAATLDGSDVRRCWYRPDLALRAEIIAAWKQFNADLAAYVVPAERTPEPVAAKKVSLPALVVDVEGKVIQSNLQDWKIAAISHIETINTTLVTDQDFADADEAVKWCEASKTRLQEVKAAALARMTSVETLFSAIDEIVATMDGKRRTLANLVTARKEARKNEIVEKGRAELGKHVAAKEQALRDLLPEGIVVRENLMPPIAGDFAGAIKSKRNFANMESAVSEEVAARKVEANKAGELREKNLRALQTKAAAHKHLFADWRDLIGKDAELVEMTIGQRIQAEKEAEERRLAAERERIAAQERARLDREQQEREAAERRQREEAEAAARADQYRIDAMDVAEQERAGEERMQRAATERLRQHQEALHATSEQLKAAALPLPELPPIDNVVPMPTKAPVGPPTLKLGEINARLAPLSIDAAGLSVLGFPFAATDKNAKLYHEHDYPRICAALIAHLTRCQQKKAA